MDEDLDLILEERTEDSDETRRIKRRINILREKIRHLEQIRDPRDQLAAKVMFADLPTPSEAALNPQKTMVPYDPLLQKDLPEWATARLLPYSSHDHSTPLNTALLDPVFSQFLEIYENKDRAYIVKSRAYDCAQSLIMEAAESIAPERSPSARRFSWDFIDIFYSHIDLKLKKRNIVPKGADDNNTTNTTNTTNTNATNATTNDTTSKSLGMTDGTAICNGMPVLQVKVKKSGDLANAQIENDFAFMRMAADEQGRVPGVFRTREFRPICFMVEIYESHILVIRGAIFAPPSILSTTLATVNMICPLHSDEHVTLARAMRGLKKEVVRLNRRYHSWGRDVLMSGPLDYLPVADNIGRLLPRNLFVDVFKYPT